MLFPELVVTEIIKYRRTIIPWLVGAGGILASGIAFLQKITNASQVHWEPLAQTGLNMINLMALLLAAVFSGHVFTAEYHENMASIVFTYPVSRFKIYLAKHLVILLLVVSLYLAFFLSIVVFGFTSVGELPSASFLLKLLKVVLLLSGANYVLVPVTALISLAVKGVGTYILAGMGYFMVYVGFINSDYSLWIPPCIPDRLAANYFMVEVMTKPDFTTILSVSAAVFFSAFFIGAVYYSRSGVYK